MNKLFTGKNLLNILFAILLLSILSIPSAKALLIRGFMSIGLFSADISATSPVNSAVVLPPDLAFKDSSGKTLSITDLKGKVVVVNFWATWCPPCLAEMPSINSLHQKFKDNAGVVFVMVDADGDLKKSGSFMAGHNYDLPLYQVASAVPQSIYNGTLPTTVIVNTAGQVVFKHEGAADYNSREVEEYLNKLLQSRMSYN